MRIFISYRRHDSKYQARMIHEAFAQEVSRENVFMDVDSIPPGANFRKLLKDWVAQCDVVLALIGPDWIHATDPLTGKRRLENPSDFVRIEISEALARDIPVAPILLDGAPPPDADQLPSDLKELCDRQAEFIDYRTFDTDVQRLIKKLRVASSNIVVRSNKIKGLASSLDRPPLKKYSLCTRREKNSRAGRGVRAPKLPQPGKLFSRCRGCTIHKPQPKTQRTGKAEIAGSKL